MKLIVSHIKKQNLNVITLFLFREEKIIYKPGQYLPIKIIYNSKEYIRCYSIHTSPHIDNHIGITIKKKELISEYIYSTVQLNDRVLADNPSGNFTTNIYKSNKRYLVFIAGGTGITPLISMIKSVLHIEKNTNIILIYFNKYQNSILFKDEIDSLKKLNPNFDVNYILTQPSSTWNGYKDRINENHLISLLKESPKNQFNQKEYFVCGPKGMVEKSIHLLKDLGVDIKNIFWEGKIKLTK